LEGRTVTNQLNWPRWQQVLLIALLVVLIGNCMTVLVDAATCRAGLFGEVAFDAGRPTPDPSGP
jgi:hypothetical protein